MKYTRYQCRRLGISQSLHGNGRVLREDDGRKSHGKSHLPEYAIWQTMKARCYNKNNKSYSCYGGRGITVCARWLKGFAPFFSDMGPANGLTLERRDNSLGYTPDNCIWAPRIIQMRNTRRNLFITFNGRTQTCSAWSSELGMKQATLCHRIRSGWSAELALTTPVAPWHR